MVILLKLYQKIKIIIIFNNKIIIHNILQINIMYYKTNPFKINNNFIKIIVNILLYN